MNEITEFFNEHGYYHAKGVFDPAQVALLEQSFNGIIAQLQASDEDINARWESASSRLGAADTQVWHTHQVQCYDAAWLQAFQHEQLLDCAEAILGPDIVLHHSKLFCKPASLGAPFPMHQDWEYFPTQKDTMIAGIIHVSEATDDMGCLRVYPGSHKLGRVTGLSEGGGSAIPNETVLAQYPIENATVVEAEPGDVVFFHYFTLHGSMPNRSESARKTVLMQLHAGDDCIEDNGHPYAGLTLRGRNHTMTRRVAGHV